MIVYRSKNVARNPVARAVAKDRLKKMMLDSQIHLFMLDEGDNAASMVLPISDGIFVMAEAYSLSKKEDTPEYRKLKSAMNVLQECAERQFKWHTMDAITINNAIQICVDHWTEIKSNVFHQAIQNILGSRNGA